MAHGFWASVKRGDRVVTDGGELVGEVVSVGASEVWVRDPLERRELSIPRAAFASRSDDGLRLGPRPVRARGEGPERFRRRGNLDDEWIAEQTAAGMALTVEGEDPLHGRRLVDEGVAGSASDDPGEAGDNVPSELAHDQPTRPRHIERGGTRIGGADRPSARELTPSITAAQRAPEERDPTRRAR